MSMAVKNFAYTSRNDAGKIVKGKVEAPSEAAALSKIRGLGLQPVTVAEATAGTGLQREIKIPGFEKGVDLKSLAIMSRQMATMISSGLSLLKALSILASQTENKKLAGILQQVTVDVEQGSSLSDSFAKHPVDFPPLMINLIRAGETGGFLEKANELVLKDRQRLPIVAVGSAWAMQKGKVKIQARVDEDTLAMNIKPATN